LNSDIFGAVKALPTANEFGAVIDGETDFCWSDEDLLDLLDFPDELAMDSDAFTSSEDDSSIGYSSLSDDSLSLTAPLPLPSVFNMGANFGLRSQEEGFVFLPDPISFSHVMFKTPEMIREEKLNVINPFIDAMNEGDLFSLFTICQQQCSPDMQLYSQSCGFKYSGIMSIITFWTLLFQKHYQGNLQCLERRVSSLNMPKSQQIVGLPMGTFDSVNFVLKLEGCRLTPFNGFDIFQHLMNSGYVHNNLSLHELIHLVDAFHLQYQQSQVASLHPAQQQQQQQQLYHVTYLFEVNIRFHAINHTISSWDWEILGVETH
jgi:hypothetical protein